MVAILTFLLGFFMGIIALGLFLHRESRKLSRKAEAEFEGFKQDLLRTMRKTSLDSDTDEMLQ